MINKYTWEEQKKIVKDYSKLIRKKTMTNEEKCKAGVYDSVNVVIIRLKKILSNYKISKKVRNSLGVPSLLSSELPSSSTR